MSKKVTLKAKLTSYRSLPKFIDAPPEEISRGIKRLEDFGLTPANMHPMTALSDRGQSTLRYSVAEIWSQRQKLSFLKRSGLLPAALEMERRAFRRALQIKKMDAPRDRDIKYMQREKNRPRGEAPPKLIGEDSMRLLEQIHLIRTRPVSVFRLRPVHSNDDLLPQFISAREIENNKSFTERAKVRLENIESQCTSLMSPEKSKSPPKTKFSPTEAFIKRRNPLKLRISRFLKNKIIRLADALNAE
mmetsp:Transcript_5301/g.9727  ORF Transcript_5301/g.9727 Transcript_5301/m.9727 type:complete len:246 (-) Transcript_5301:63-800(-)|eukprot:CAMPEP_0204907912 /NCGR_PEP_ID=MMETSP1397-20131031/6952_1 /ASSEMBLY_ACC=CAM_ASM_000891 /TAXON_ID=49980 /ORGANISM="Climacostomum Climacostomum virens, Strain Stock W-24" /LENGTH=245 /DNA_ID=CAMNT_0052077227 /DNA_START=835 /DNA_END=1572 /DNA_ORIENTATION=+